MSKKRANARAELVQYLKGKGKNDYLQKISVIVGDEAHYVNRLDNDNKTSSLHLASYYNDIKLIKLLIDSGANVNIVDRLCRTPLIALCELSGQNQSEKNRRKIAEILLKAGADINAQTQDGDTALYFAINYRSPKTINFLIKNSADVNLASNKNQTPLMVAVFCGDSDTVKILLDYGADINIKNDRGETAVSIADDFAKTDENGLGKIGLKEYRKIVEIFKTHLFEKQVLFTGQAPCNFSI